MSAIPLRQPNTRATCRYCLRRIHGGYAAQIRECRACQRSQRPSVNDGRMAKGFRP